MRNTYFLALVGTIALIAGCSGGSKNDSGPIPVVSASPSTSSTPSNIASSTPTSTPTTVASNTPTAKPTTTPVAPSPTPSPSAAATPTQNVALFSDNNQSCGAGTYFGDSMTRFPSTFYCNNSYMPNSSQTPPPAANGDTEYLTSAFQAYDSTNATGTSATSSASFYSGTINTSKYPVPGTAFAGMQYTMSDTPSVLDFGGNSYFTLNFGFEIPNTTNPVSQNGETYYCTVFDNFTQIGSGSGTSTVEAGAGSPFTSTEVEGCNTTSNTSNTSINDSTGGGDTNSINVSLSNTTTYNIGDTYTIILSH